MSRARAWSYAFVTGVVTFFATSFALYLPLVIAVLLAATGLYGRRLAGVSGVLSGFGATWCLFVGWQLATGANYDQGLLVLAPGVLPLVLGILAGAVALSREG
jgi:hypothetical protein